MQSDALPDDSETLKTMLLAERVQNERLRQIIRELQRHRFGRRAETLPEDQMLLGLEDVEQAEANRAAETDGSSPADRQVRAHKRRINRGALPAHLGARRYCPTFARHSAAPRLAPIRTRMNDDLAKFRAP